MGADDRPDLADVDVLDVRDAFAEAGGEGLRAGGRGEVLDAQVDAPLPAAATASSSSRASAREDVRTFSSGASRPSAMSSSGFTISAEPTKVAAAPIRPPRRRCSSVST